MAHHHEQEELVRDLTEKLKLERYENPDKIHNKEMKPNKEGSIVDVTQPVPINS